MLDFAFTPFAKEHAAVAAAIDAASSPVPWTRSHFEEELEKKHARFWAVSNRTGVVAFGGFWLLDDWAEIPNIAVHPGWRRQGVGRRLLAFLCAEAKAAGARKISLEVREDNAPARRLYHSLGFRETSRRPKFYNGHTDAVLMEKILA